MTADDPKRKTAASIAVDTERSRRPPVAVALPPAEVARRRRIARIRARAERMARKEMTR